MAGLAAHLHYHEPSNYILVSFLRRGLFHKFCKPVKNGKDAIPSQQNKILAIFILKECFAYRLIEKRKINIK